MSNYTPYGECMLASSYFVAINKLIEYDKTISIANVCVAMKRKSDGKILFNRVTWPTYNDIKKVILLYNGHLEDYVEGFIDNEGNFIDKDQVAVLLNDYSD